MTLATHRTHTPAARKRGGGLAHIPQDRAVANGRQQMPEGGEITASAAQRQASSQPYPAPAPRSDTPRQACAAPQKWGQRSASRAARTRSLLRGISVLNTIN